MMYVVDGVAFKPKLVYRTTCELKPADISDTWIAAKAIIAATYVIEQFVG